MAKIASRQLGVFSDFIGSLRIRSKEHSDALGEGTPLILWESQRRFMAEVAEGIDGGVRIFKCLKSRQLGITTVSLAIDIFWLAMHPGITGALVTENEANRDKNRKVLKQYMDSFPEGYFGTDFKIIGDNRQHMLFSNGSRLDFKVAGTKDKGTAWGEGEGYTFAHLTEIASYGSEPALKSFEEAYSQTNPQRLYIYESPLALDTPIPVPGGWSTIGDLEEGDTVFDEEGYPVQVLGTSPVFTDRTCYRLTFDNGDSIVADADHKWRVAVKRWHNNPQWKMKDIRTADLDTEFNFIYITEPLELPETDLPLDPYFVGAWLGDGATAEPRITAANEDLDDMCALLRTRGMKIGTITRSKDRAPMFHVLGIRDTFIQMGLKGNKHIPEAYLRASERQRRELLAGLMDTDGSVHKKNYQCNFSSTLEPLIDQVGELLSSLGIKYVKQVNSEGGKVRLFPQGHYSTCQKSWRLLFSEHPTRKVFNLPRKKAIQETPRTPVWRKTKRLRITSIAAVPSVPVKCIAVDTPSHLFLAGRTMVPTHNTAKGDNLWRSSWESGNRDPYTQRSFFIGWWASGINRIQRNDPRFAQYGLDRPDAEEREKIKAVLDLYDYKVDEEQLCWYRWRQANAGSDDGMLDQNQPWTAKEAFVQSGQSFFQTRLLAQEIRKLDDDPPLRLAYRYEFGETFFQMQLHECPEGTPLDDIELRVWEEPVDGGQYIIGCDPAYGRTEHGDQIAIQVYRAFADRIVQVAEYATYETEVKYAAWVLAHLAGAYKDCMVNMEIYGGGEVIMNEWSNLRAMLNSEMYAKAAKSGEWTDALDMARWYLYARTDTIGGRPAAYNFQTTHKTKYQLMVGMRGSYVTKELMIRSKFLLAEMMNVVQDGQSIGAPDSSSQSCKDDRVFATAFAIRAWNEWYKTDLISKGFTYAIAMAEERGEVGTHVRSLNTMVQRFFQSAAMAAANEMPVPTWRDDRGLN